MGRNNHHAGLHMIRYKHYSEYDDSDYGHYIHQCYSDEEIQKQNLKWSGNNEFSPKVICVNKKRLLKEKKKANNKSDYGKKHIVVNGVKYVSVSLDTPDIDVPVYTSAPNSANNHIKESKKKKSNKKSKKKKNRAR